MFENWGQILVNNFIFLFFLVGFTFFLKDIVDKLVFYQEFNQRDNFLDIYNKIYIEKYYNQLRDRALNRIVTLAYLDLDNFKAVNDTYGHASGDFLLKLFVNLLKKYFGDKGVVARIGGDEFCVFLEKDYDQSNIILNELKKNLERDLTWKGWSLGVNIGVTTFDKILDKTDNLMYKAKKSRLPEVKHTNLLYNEKVKIS